MHKLDIEDLHSLEEYARIRPEFRRRVMEHKQHRRLPLGDHVTLYFEDRLTMQYQVQEMLRVERLFEEGEIRSELDAYNPLIPDGSNWKATLMVEFPDAGERRRQLTRLIGIENCVWLQVEGHQRIMPIADEDLERTSEEKTSSVHFLRFELAPEMISDLRQGASLRAGVDHPEYCPVDIEVPETVRESLIADLD